MVLVQFAVDGEGQYLGTTKNTPASMHHTMKDLWKLLVHDGVITQVRTKVPLSLLHRNKWTLLCLREKYH